MMPAQSTLNLKPSTTSVQGGVRPTNAMRILSLFMGVALGMAAALNSNANQNLLSDPGFESGTPVAGGNGGWTPVVDATFSQTYSHSGAWSMETYYDPSWILGVSDQGVAVTPGADYMLTGWAFTPNTLSSAQGMVGIFFDDANGELIGQYLTSATLGSASPANIWIQLSVGGIAPANAASVWAETLLWNPGPGDAVYFDDLSLTMVPEPSTLAVLSAGLGLGLLGRRRTRQAM